MSNAERRLKNEEVGIKYEVPACGRQAKYGMFTNVEYPMPSEEF